MTTELDMLSATLCRDSGRVYLRIWHDKGCTVLQLIGGVWHFVDKSSRGSFADVLKDLR